VKRGIAGLPFQVFLVPEVPIGNVRIIARRLPKGISAKWQHIAQGRSSREKRVLAYEPALEMEWIAPMWICGRIGAKKSLTKQ
jgi:hypothetical protein